MLQDRPLPPPLRTAANLGFANQHIAGSPSLKTEKWFPSGLDFVGRRAQSGCDAKALEGLDQAAMNGLIKVIAVVRQPMSPRQYDAVGQLGVVHDCPTAGQPSHSSAREAGRMFLTIGVSLEIPQRECRCAPTVKTEASGCLILGPLQEHFVYGHVPRTAFQGVAEQSATARIDHACGFQVSLG